MLLGKPFARFMKESPISVMMRGIIEYAFEAERLNGLFEDTAEAQYTRTLHFSTVADLMSEVVFNISPSIGAAYQANIDQMIVSRKSVYNKLNGIEPQISAALVDDSVTQFAPVVEKLGATLPPLLPGYRVKIIDGNHFSATEHRIEELRTIGDAPLPGKALVVLDPLLKLATHVFPCEDGHAQERSLLDQVLPCVESGDLWIGRPEFLHAGILVRHPITWGEVSGSSTRQPAWALARQAQIHGPHPDRESLRAIDGDYGPGDRDHDVNPTNHRQTVQTNAGW